MYENTCLWLFFCMLPSFSFAVILIFGRTFYNTKQRIFMGYSMYSNYSLTILLKEPPIMYAPRTLDVTRIEDLKNRTSFEISSKMVFFEMDYRLCYINNILTVCLASIGLVLKAQLKWELVLLSSSLFLTITTCLLYMVRKLDDGSSKRCFEHAEEKSDCTESTEKYGLYVKDYKQFEVCRYHKNSLPCRACSKYNL